MGFLTDSTTTAGATFLTTGPSLRIDGDRVEMVYHAGTVGFGVRRVLHNRPATIVEWTDGTKTVVVCREGDVYDGREGFLLCCAKRLMGNTGRFNDEMREHAMGHHEVEFALSEVSAWLS